jgi:hypothetical protein
MCRRDDGWSYGHLTHTCTRYPACKSSSRWPPNLIFFDLTVLATISKDPASAERMLPQSSVLLDLSPRRFCNSFLPQCLSQDERSRLRSGYETLSLFDHPEINVVTAPLYDFFLMPTTRTQDHQLSTLFAHPHRDFLYYSDTLPRALEGYTQVDCILKIKDLVRD